MDSTKNFRFALLSHVLPPSPSGQAVMLYRILSGFVPQEYYLISRELYKKSSSSEDCIECLPVRYYGLKPAHSFAFIDHLKPWFVRETIRICAVIICRTRELVSILRECPVGVIVACSGDIADIPAGFLAGRIMGTPFIAYLFDDYVFQWTEFYRFFAKFVAQFIFKQCAGIIGANEYICDEYMRRYGVQSMVVRNPCVVDDLPVLSENVSFQNGLVRIMYTGSIYHANYDCFRNLIQAMDEITHQQVELHVYTAQSVEELNAQGLGSEKVHIHSHVPYNQILAEQHKADILFLPLAFDSPISEVIRTSAPGKMGEYLASGRPVLAHVPPDSFVAYYMKKYQCGIVADENSSTSLSEHILNLIRNEPLRHNVVKNARQQARLDFDPKRSQQRLSDFISSIIDRKTK
jgi:glycosyltransferase involved in cell wall biosynthesis